MTTRLSPLDWTEYSPSQEELEDSSAWATLDGRLDAVCQDASTPLVRVVVALDWAEYTEAPTDHRAQWERWVDSLPGFAAATDTVDEHTLNTTSTTSNP
uniref:Uncharacterized protein n=1 Tax=viral metagenome TaxID=1070528 RepID=A0A6H2A335_9ZZZZ